MLNSVTDLICHRSNCHQYGLSPIWLVSESTTAPSQWLLRGIYHARSRLVYW